MTLHIPSAWLTFVSLFFFELPGFCSQLCDRGAGIPIEKVSSDESEKLIKMEETLHNRVIGQEEAVVAISRAIRRARVGKLTALLQRG